MIKFNLVKFEKELIFQVLDQSIQSCNRINYGIYVNYNGLNYGVKSISSPDISFLIKNKTIYIRGSDLASNFVRTSILFDTNIERDYYYDIVINVLKKAFSNEILFKGKHHYDVCEDINFYNYI